MTTTLIAPISNMQCPAPVSLGDDTEIHHFHRALLPLVQKARDKWLIRHPAQYTHSLVIRNSHVSRADRTDAKERIEEAILRLRLFKAGSVGFNFAALDKDGWYDELNTKNQQDIRCELIGVFFYVVWDRPGIPPVYELRSEEVEQLRSLFALAAGQRLMDRSSFRFFFRGYHEPYATDRFLSNAIGLENLLVNDVTDLSNITYKFVDRGCFLLSQAQAHPNGAEGYVSTLKDIYTARSKIVHSNKRTDRDWSTDKELYLLRISEDYLRTLLNFVLHNPEMGNSEAVDRAKRKKYT